MTRRGSRVKDREEGGRDAICYHKNIQSHVFISQSHQRINKEFNRKKPYADCHKVMGFIFTMLCHIMCFHGKHVRRMNYVFKK